jgi:hypothetical protein
VLRHAIVLFALLITPPASAMTRIASDGRATISELEVLVEPDSWTVRARLDGHASRLALLFVAPGATDASVLEPALFDTIDHQTAPRFVVTDAADPCAAAKPNVLAGFWPTRTTPAAGGFTATVIAPARTEQLDAALAGLSLDADSKAILARSVRDGAQLVMLSGPSPGKLRGFWTPPVRIAVKSRSLPLGLAAPHVTVGNDLRVELYVRGSLAPKGRSVDLPSQIHFPEVAFEDPFDLYRATTVQTVRREGAGTIVRIFSGELSRWFLRVGRNDARATVELEERTLPPFAAKWSIRRVWRKPIGCSAKQRYLQNVRLQQKTEIQTHAATTGRTQASIEAWMKQRGYLLQDGELAPVEIRSP